MPEPSKDRTTIYLTEQDKANIKAILAAMPYLRSATGAITYALTLAASRGNRDAQEQPQPTTPVNRDIKITRG